jgi:hypothetical protein
MSKERILLAALSVLTLVITGCGNGLASVTGAVTLDGQAITGPNKYGTVSFYRESGGGAPAIGIMDQTGHYTLKTGSADGIEPGTYRVAIAVKKVTPATQQDGLSTATLITPEKYSSTQQSGFRHEVKPGRNTIDFALSSKGP